MTIKIAVIQFPGSNCDLDTLHVLNNVISNGIEAELIWHNHFKEAQFDGVVLPGGFSFGDYLRSGIIAAHSPALDEARIMLKDGKPIIGICNGFQILAEAQFLPGALLRNDSLKFICKWVNIKVENNKTAFTSKMNIGDVLAIPIAHGEGRYYTDKLKELEENNQIVFRYSTENGELTEQANPNGSLESIAGVCNLEQNCLGLMPHPERASEPILSPKQTMHGRLFFESMVEFIKRRVS
jgi:phosphoribosylformylglycinamidine synthase